MEDSEYEMEKMRMELISLCIEKDDYFNIIKAMTPNDNAIMITIERQGGNRNFIIIGSSKFL